MPAGKPTHSPDNIDPTTVKLTRIRSAPTPLPAPAAGLTLTHVAIGRGTQNYTCDLSNSTAVPVAVGAVATLFNASCTAADQPALMAKLPGIALNLPVPTMTETSSPVTQSVLGHHFFTDSTTAFFDLDTLLHSYGRGAFKKVNATAAPTGATDGQFGTGHGSVAWLKLDMKTPGTDQGFQEVYRLNTAGGNPPASCAGSPAAFEVQYAAEYWFYS